MMFFNAKSEKKTLRTTRRVLRAAAAMLLCAILCVTAGACAKSGGELEFTTGGDFAVLSKCRSTEAEIVIPSEYDGKPVVGVGSGAFSGCRKVESVTLPDGVLTLEPEAFKGCKSLSSISLPDSLNVIGRGAFIDCSSLAEITIPDSVTLIGRGAFFGCNITVRAPHEASFYGEGCDTGDGVEWVVTD